ncbi:MAG: ribosome small subunit-dependent GTPase A [bacterium]|nr:ribosome small subunit-dependent GTPase A [bacterium]
MSELIATVARRTKGFYYLRTPEGVEVECKAKGALFQKSKFDNQIAVGDRVSYRMGEGEDIGLISALEERKSFLSRARVGIEAEQVIAANVDVMFISLAAKQPDPRAGLVWRMLVAASLGNVRPVLVMTKMDLVHHHKDLPFLRPFLNIDLEILFSSKGGSADDARLAELIGSSVCVFSGPSGVGKSSLINRLFPGLDLKVGEISEKTQKGAHTTTYARMISIGEAGQVIDTPGIREFSLWGATKDNLRFHFPLIKDYSGHCKHADCTHTHEPHCNVKAEVQKELLDREVYEGYLALMGEI